MSALRNLALTLAAVLTLFTGCRSVPHSGHSEFQPDQHYDDMGLSPRNALMAEALANYGMGVLREGQHDPGAVSNYLRAIELEPDLNAIYLRVAVEHIRHGNRKLAVSIMEDACRSNPKSAEARLLLSQVHQILNQQDEARKAAGEAISLAPKNYKCYIQLASVCISMRDEKNAEEVLRQAAGKADEKLPVLRMLGDLYAQRIRSVSPPSSDIKNAIYYYEKAAAYPSDDLSIVYLQRLGDLYLIDRRSDKALSCFKEITVHDPDNVQAQQKLALCYIALGKREKALAALKSMAGREPQNPDLYYYLGELYDSLGDTEQAIESYKTARDFEPTNPKSYIKMAIIQLRDNPQKAKETLQTGLKRMPKERLFIEILAQIYLRNSQYHEALALFEQMLATLPPNDAIFKDPRFFIHYGVAAQECLMPDKAAMLYERALEIDPHSLEARMRLAMLALWLDDPDEAVGLVEDAVIENPLDAASWFFYALICSRAGEYQNAIFAFARTEELAKRLSDKGTTALDTSFYFNYGSACERNGNYGKAEELLQKAILLDPENSEAFNYLAYMWAERGIKLDRALMYISQALDIEPDNGAYLDTLGWILFKQKKYREALSNIQNAIVLMPDDPTILDHFGDILFKVGKKDEAVAVWKESFMNDGANATLERKLREQGVDTDALRRTPKPALESPPWNE